MTRRHALNETAVFASALSAIPPGPSKRSNVPHANCSHPYAAGQDFRRRRGRQLSPVFGRRRLAARPAPCHQALRRRLCTGLRRTGRARGRQARRAGRPAHQERDLRWQELLRPRPRIRSKRRRSVRRQAGRAGRSGDLHQVDLLACRSGAEDRGVLGPDPYGRLRRRVRRGDRQARQERQTRRRARLRVRLHATSNGFSARAWTVSARSALIS